MTDLDTVFATFKHDAWRVEALDEYDVPGTAERVAEFRRTGSVDPIPRWDGVVRSAITRGARIGRIRLVGYPMNEYTKYELAAYRNNVAAGESVHLIDRRWLDPSWADAPDFWMVDSQVWVMRYDNRGAFLGSEHVADPSPYQELRARIERLAVPLAEFHLADVPGPRPESAPTALLPTGLLSTH